MSRFAKIFAIQEGLMDFQDSGGDLKRWEGKIQGVHTPVGAAMMKCAAWEGRCRSRSLFVLCILSRGIRSYDFMTGK